MIFPLKRKEFIKEETRLKDLLKKQLSQVIYSRVKQEQSFVKSEFGYKENLSYTERFTSNAYIESDIELWHSQTLTHIHYKEKAIYGFM